MGKDVVNHPSHYEGKVECIEAIESAVKGLEGIEAADTANAIKYLWRWKKKNGVEDLKKAIWYIKDLLKRLGEPEEEKRLDSLEELAGMTVEQFRQKYGGCNSDVSRVTHGILGRKYKAGGKVYILSKLDYYSDCYPRVLSMEVVDRLELTLEELNGTQNSIVITLYSEFRGGIR